jgi:hypothetical protein
VASCEPTVGAHKAHHSDAEAALRVHSVLAFSSTKVQLLTHFAALSDAGESLYAQSTSSNSSSSSGGGGGSSTISGSSSGSSGVLSAPHPHPQSVTTTRKRDAAVAAARTAATLLRPAATATFRREESEGGGSSESSLEGRDLEGARGEDSFLKFMQVFFFSGSGWRR